MHSIDQETILAIRQNRLVIDCIQMTLRRQSGGPETYVGGGTIRQTSEGGLEYVLYDTTSEVSTKDVLTSRVAVGEFLTADDFWTLTATDVKGNSWIAEWVDADTSSVFGERGAIVRGTFDHITHAADRVSKDSDFWAFAPADVRLPANAITETITKAAERESKGWTTNLWKVDCAKAGALTATQFDDGIQVHLENDNRELPPQIRVRLEEALTFVLSTPIHWLIEQALSGDVLTVTIRSRRAVFGNPRLPPPLGLNTAEARSDVGLLLRQYLSYLLAFPPPQDESHPLALSMSRVLRASGGALEDESLTLATEVESVVRAHFINHGRPTQVFLDAIEDVLQHIATWTGSPDAAKRIIGSIQQLKGGSPRNALQELVKQKVIAKRHLDAWISVRNRAAHGLRSSKSVREAVTLNAFVQQLLLLLVFEIVGYKGLFSDRTTKGYPLTTPAESART